MGECKYYYNSKFKLNLHFNIKTIDTDLHQIHSSFA